MADTRIDGVLRIGTAFPDPPFDLMDQDEANGFDIALMRAVAARLKLEPEFVPFTGADFNDIFAGLDDGSWDCVASGATITPERQARADFAEPYIVSGQSLVAAPGRHPALRSLDDLAGLVIGVQKGNTSEPVAERLKHEGRVADVRLYPYHGIGDMLGDVEAGRIAAAMKLEPVMRWLIRSRPALRIVQAGITEERLAVSVRRGNAGLLQAIDQAQAALKADGTLAALLARWVPS